MAWNVTLGMDEDERDYLLFQGRCESCGHFRALHYIHDVWSAKARRMKRSPVCGLKKCDCGTAKGID